MSKPIRHSSWPHQLFLLAGLLMTCIPVVSYAQGPAVSASPVVTLWKHGRAVKLDPKDKRYALLVSACEKTLGAATDSLNLIVTDRLIHHLKTDETSIELVYRTKQHSLIHKYSHTVAYDHLLIPLSGEYAGTLKEPLVTIFWGVGGYGAGPFGNFKPDLLQLIARLKL